jgi:hypothetical protein
MATFFNEYFGVTIEQVEDYGAFNVSLIPLFIDPFLLFHSKKPEYQELHNDILKYMIFLREAVTAVRVDDDLVRAWFLFPETKLVWVFTQGQRRKRVRT